MNLAAAAASAGMTSGIVSRRSSCSEAGFSDGSVQGRTMYLESSTLQAHLLQQNQQQQQQQSHLQQSQQFQPPPPHPQHQQNMTEDFRSRRRKSERSEEILFSSLMPPSAIIVGKQYSLEADMIFGWQPRITRQGPIPLQFEDSLVNSMIIHLKKKQQEYDAQIAGNNPMQSTQSTAINIPSAITNAATPKAFPRLVYLGFRPANSLRLHQAYSDSEVSGAYEYKSIAVAQTRMDEILTLMEKKNNANRLKMPFEGMNPKLLMKRSSKLLEATPIASVISAEFAQDHHRRHSKEGTSGKISDKAVTQVSQIEMGEDNEDIERIVQFDAKFESGNLDCAVQVGAFEYDLFMRVDSNTKGHLTWYYFSAKVAKPNTRIKFNICNCRKDKSLYTRGMKPFVFSEKSDSGWSQQGENVTYAMKSFRGDLNPDQKTYYCLSFEYVFSGGEEDVVKFAYCPPYTFSDLIRYLKSLNKSEQEQGIKYLKEERFCQSMSGLEVPMLTITDLSVEEEKIAERKVVIVQARIHPGESNSSYVMHGFLEWICSNDKAAIDLREKCVFKVIPMMNPDGVIAGNFRTGFAGRDLNRMFKSTDKMLFPSVVALKELVRETKRVHGKNVIMFLDLHGHSVKKNVFTYGPDYPIFDVNYFKCRLFSKILSKNSRMFRYFSCIFRISQMKKHTARGILFRNFDVPNCFTVEASNGSYYLGNAQTEPFSIADWMKMGVQMGEGIREYLQVTEEFEMQRKARLTQLAIGVPVVKKPISITSNECLTRRIRNESNDKGISATTVVEANNNNGQQQMLSQSLVSQNQQNGNSERKKKSGRGKSNGNSKKNFTMEKNFFVDETPFASYFNKELEEKEKILEEESDGFSEKGMDSDSDGDDFDKGFLKNFEMSIQSNMIQFEKLCSSKSSAFTSGVSEKQPIKERRTRSLKEPSRFVRRETVMTLASKQMLKQSMETIDRLEMKRRMLSTANTTGTSGLIENRSMRTSSFVHAKLNAALTAKTLIKKPGSIIMQAGIRKFDSQYPSSQQQQLSTTTTQLQQYTQHDTLTNFTSNESRLNPATHQEMMASVRRAASSAHVEESSESMLSHHNHPLSAKKQQQQQSHPQSQSSHHRDESEENLPIIDNLAAHSKNQQGNLVKFNTISSITSYDPQQAKSTDIPSKAKLFHLKVKKPTEMTLVTPLVLLSTSDAYPTQTQQQQQQQQQPTQLLASQHPPYPVNFPNKLFKQRVQQQQEFYEFQQLQLQQQQQQQQQLLSQQESTTIIPQEQSKNRTTMNSGGFRREKIMTPMELLQLTSVVQQQQQQQQPANNGNSLNASTLQQQYQQYQQYQFQQQQLQQQQQLNASPYQAILQYQQRYQLQQQQQQLQLQQQQYQQQQQLLLQQQQQLLLSSQPMQLLQHSSQFQQMSSLPQQQQQLNSNSQHNSKPSSSHPQQRRHTNMTTFAHQFKMQKAQFQQSEVARHYQAQQYSYSTTNKDHFFQSYISTNSATLFEKDGLLSQNGLVGNSNSGNSNSNSNGSSGNNYGGSVISNGTVAGAPGIGGGYACIGGDKKSPKNLTKPLELSLEIKPIEAALPPHVSAAAAGNLGSANRGVVVASPKHFNQVHHSSFHHPSNNGNQQALVGNSKLYAATNILAGTGGISQSIPVGGASVNGTHSTSVSGVTPVISPTRKYGNKEISFDPKTSPPLTSGEVIAAASNLNPNAVEVRTKSALYRVKQASKPFVYMPSNVSK